MNEIHQETHLTSYVSMFEEIKNNYGIDILKCDSFEKFMFEFFSSLLTAEELEAVPSELVILNKVIEKVKIA
ncbi:hypothetical protein [Lysinibacillus sp. Ag94]|uniref:hypothetical protein n=1 Tax=Lysinibacillus sp. Ag94 TaxID=2936682 RepID=UPI00200DA1F6|nr:hypothetical protein [Lysinibacillus sp. Ag94]UPW82299.1 hypothetical protein MY533_16325 [Lysinibacillus sp. Ag94]